MALPFKPSKELELKLKREGSWNTVKEYAWGLRFFETIVMYLRDRKYKKYRENIHTWVKENTSLPSDVMKWASNLNRTTSRDAKMRQILRYVNKEIEYVTDSDNWKAVEYWASPKQTCMNYQGDCEDGAMLVYSIAKYVGIPDDCIWLVASDVQGGGHCYVVYEAEDGQEYPIDWCYWFNTSVNMDVTYWMRYEYYQGTREWFRVNSTGSWKPKSNKVFK